MNKIVSLEQRKIVFVAGGAEDKNNLPVTLEGCLEFCNAAHVYGDWAGRNQALCHHGCIKILKDKVGRD